MEPSNLIPNFIMSLERLQTFSLPLRSNPAPRIFQGFNGPFSHQDDLQTPRGAIKRLRWSVDFATAFGSEVKVAKSGRVLFISRHRDSFRGMDPALGLDVPGTWLAVQHEGKVTSLYSHLDADRIFVRKGQVVERGEVLALTGETGWVGAVPHLHFHAIQCARSIPFEFEDQAFPSLEDGLLFGDMSVQDRVGLLLASI